MIEIRCVKGEKKFSVETAGTFVDMAEETANIISGLTRSILNNLPPEARKSAAQILKQAIVLGYRKRLERVKEAEEKTHEAAE